MAARQIHLCVGLTLADPKDTGSDNSPNPFICGLNTWLSPKMLGLTARQTHIYLDSTFIRLVYVWSQCLTELKDVWLLLCFWFL
jgi:hypothetical protein